MELFYVDKDVSESFALNEEESNHVIRTLRFRQGSIIFLTDGKGNFFKAAITGEDPKACLVKIIETTHEYKKRSYRLHIAIAPTKSTERFEWFLEKTTEIGIDE